MHLAPLLEGSHMNFVEIYCIITLESLGWAIVQRCFLDPMFSHFDTIPAYDRWTDRWTCNDSKYCASIE